MPKYKFRKGRDDIRINKGKNAFEMNSEILEQCDNEEKSFSSDEESQPKPVESSQIDRRTFDEIMFDAFKQFDSKSSQTRSNALEIISVQLQSSHNSAFLSENNEMLLNIVQNALQNDNPSEMEWAARIISIAAIQLPHSNRTMQVVEKTLKAALENRNIQFSVRSAVCHAIAILTFLYAKDKEIYAVMQSFKDIFYPKHYNFPLNETNESFQMANFEFRIAALEAWTFLTTLLPSMDTFSNGNIFVLLESPYFNMRVACAKAIAVIFECGIDNDKTNVKRNSTKIMQNLSEITRAWKKQSHILKTPREVLLYLQKGITPRREIRIGKLVMDLNTWALNIKYDMLCNVLGSANITKHFSKNKQLLTKMKLVNSPQKGSSESPACSTDPAFVSDDSSNEFHYIVHAPTPTHQDQYDFEKLTNNLERVASESTLVRKKAFEDICKELQLNHVPQNFLADKKNEILDNIIKTMKRGNEAAQILAIRLATLTVIQLGRDEQFCSKLSNIFTNLLRLPDALPSVNASVCTALAFFELVDNAHAGNVLHIMDILMRIFSASKPNNKTSNGDASSEELKLLRCKALEAWGLLLTLLSPKDVCSLVRSRTMKDLIELLRIPNVEFRIVCGQVVSIIIEQGRIHDNSYLNSDMSELCDVVKELANDQCKNISKDKRRIQAKTFREILKYLEDGSHLQFKLRFAEEIHELKTWSSLFKYQKLCDFIGPGLTTHLLQNERFREMIPLGPVPVIVPLAYKTRVQHKLSNAAKKKPKTKENRLNSRRPKFECI